jgi:hypothetical protein
MFGTDRNVGPRATDASILAKALQRLQGSWRFLKVFFSYHHRPAAWRQSVSREGRTNLMSPLLASLPTLSVSAIFCIWSAYQRFRQRNRVLRERVAYLLWVVATCVDDGGDTPPRLRSLLTPMHEPNG